MEKVIPLSAEVNCRERQNSCERDSRKQLDTQESEKTQLLRELDAAQSIADKNRKKACDKEIYTELLCGKRAIRNRNDSGRERATEWDSPLMGKKEIGEESLIDQRTL